jgi:hypothetical protein
LVVILVSLALLMQTPLVSIDLDGDTARQVVVDREAGQYLGHPATVLLEDGRTILTVYPKGHGRGAILMKKSEDGGRTWSERLPTPANWATSLETPSIHRVIDPQTGHRRLIVWSGLNPARLAVSEDDGANWSDLQPAGTWGGIVVMSSLERLANGDYMALFHDDGRYFFKEPQSTGVFSLYQTRSSDGGRTWSFPESILSDSSMHLCEPGLIRSPDGKSMAVLLRENSRKFNSQIIFSHDEGRTWTAPRALPRVLTGDRHVGKYGPDGRLLISYRDMPPQGDWKGDWVAWVGTWDDLLNGRDGQYKVRVKDNQHEWDSTYPGVELLPDGTFVLTTYGHWVRGESPFILSVRLRLSELDDRAPITR